ncbi:hypothetical protein pb186bvf_004993 [Paramecium bursaria]
MVSTIQIATDRVNQIKFIEYFQQSIDMRSMENLYYFQANNNIQINSQVDDCLLNEHSQQFYSYQYCYGTYGQLKNSTDLKQIKDFITLQNILLPMYQNKQEEKTFFTIYLDQTLFFSQYKGEHLTFIHPNLMDVFDQMDINFQSGYYQEIRNSNLSMQLIFNNIPGTKIATGVLYNYSEDEFNKITQQDRYFRQRQIFLWDSGKIIYDSRNPDLIGLMFQSSNLTGFDETQFQKIKNFTYKNLSVVNECSLHVKEKFLCLVDSGGQPKIMKIDRIGAEDYIFYYLIISDANSSVQTINEFNKELQDSINELTINIFIYFILTLVICFMSQMFFIRKLNSSLQDLQYIAKFHISNEYLNILTGIRIIQSQSSIQKLADSSQRIEIISSKKNRTENNLLKRNDIKAILINNIEINKAINNLLEGIYYVVIYDLIYKIMKFQSSLYCKKILEKSKTSKFEKQEQELNLKVIFQNFVAQVTFIQCQLKLKKGKLLQQKRAYKKALRYFISTVNKKNKSGQNKNIEELYYFFIHNE